MTEVSVDFTSAAIAAYNAYYSQVSGGTSYESFENLNDVTKNIWFGVAKASVTTFNRICAEAAVYKNPGIEKAA